MVICLRHLLVEALVALYAAVECLTLYYFLQLFQSPPVTAQALSYKEVLATASLETSLAGFHSFSFALYPPGNIPHFETMHNFSLWHPVLIIVAAVRFARSLLGTGPCLMMSILRISYLDTMSHLGTISHFITIPHHSTKDLFNATTHCQILKIWAILSGWHRWH